jgi:PLATZ transcription factor
VAEQQCGLTQSTAPCVQHTFFCMDCANMRGLCSLCVREHPSCNTIQIRRYVYRDVVKIADLTPFYDCSGVQSYTVNHNQAIFLSAKDKAPVGPYYRVDSTSRCETCKRGLRAGCTFCSLACKVRTRLVLRFLQQVSTLDA